MNIKDAKEQIKNAMRAYFAKDAFGDYRIPVERQRPVFLIGPPGIGKTAVMEQVAQEMGVGLVSYSMTHHTRQSALGLPFIVRRSFEGYEYDASEYTMSEIIGAVYDLMRGTGVREGILFLDEINCVSETLAPCMLQFLQYKVFGQHRVPPGWIVVTAGNPPEYNKSVRDFDIVTWDRLKRVDVEPDYDAWKEYAYRKGVHASVMTYLAARGQDFYRVESTVDGKSFVTARSWVDLSDMIALYEDQGVAVDEKLIVQYLQHRTVSKDFAIYYDLFNKYRSDYKVERILAGDAPEAVVLRARMAKFDERLSLLGLLIDAAASGLRAVAEAEDALSRLAGALREALPEAGAGAAPPPAEIAARLAALAERYEEGIDKGRRASSMAADEQRAWRRAVEALGRFRARLLLGGGAGADGAAGAEAGEAGADGAGADGDGAARARALYGQELAALRTQAAEAGARLENLFAFCEAAFGEGQEMLVLVTELIWNDLCARFIGHYGCERYFALNRELKFHERRQEIVARMADLGLRL
jgi:hypothetical protein